MRSRKNSIIQETIEDFESTRSIFYKDLIKDSEPCEMVKNYVKVSSNGNYIHKSREYSTFPNRPGLYQLIDDAFKPEGNFVCYPLSKCYFSPHYDGSGVDDCRQLHLFLDSLPYRFRQLDKKYAEIEKLENERKVYLFTHRKFEYDFRSQDVDLNAIRNKTETRNTCVVENIPRTLKRQEIVKTLDQHFYGCYYNLDLFVIETTGHNLGSVIINFRDVTTLGLFYRMYNGKRWNNMYGTDKVAVRFARIQDVSPHVF